VGRRRLRMRLKVFLEATEPRNILAALTWSRFVRLVTRAAFRYIRNS
jgi:hypothetical protein